MKNIEKSACIGVDLGGTNLRAALVDRSGEIIESRITQVPLDRGAERISKKLLAQCRALVRSAAKLGMEVGAIGLAVAGKIDRAGGSVIFSPNLPVLDGYPLGHDIRRNLGIPVCMENDANAFGLGESFTGAARGVRNWVGITLGTGTGGCLFLNGKLWEGDDLGFSAEIGHMIVEPGGPVCPCGSEGCLEAFASARALVSGARRAVHEQKNEESPLRALESEGKLSAQAIYACAKRGDPTALALFDKMGRALGICLANIFSALGIRRAVIGGGVSTAWDLFIGPLEKALAQNCSMLDPGLAVVTQSRLGNDAALIGAARLAAGAGRRVGEPVNRSYAKPLSKR
ncbi:MAG: ROK family protein [Syntrophobacteraceae bacterium]